MDVTSLNGYTCLLLLAILYNIQVILQTAILIQFSSVFIILYENFSTDIWKRRMCTRAAWPEGAHFHVNFVMYICGIYVLFFHIFSGARLKDRLGAPSESTNCWKLLPCMFLLQSISSHDLSLHFFFFLISCWSPFACVVVKSWKMCVLSVFLIWQCGSFAG